VLLLLGCFLFFWGHTWRKGFDDKLFLFSVSGRGGRVNLQFDFMISEWLKKIRFACKKKTCNITEGRQMRANTMHHGLDD
jgi:hypothetical protein